MGVPGQEKEKARLEEINTDEVSLVDRAANKKKFLVVKNYGGENMSDEKKEQTQEAETTEVIETEKVEDNPEASAKPTDAAEVSDAAPAATVDDGGAGTTSAPVETGEQVDVVKMFGQIADKLDVLGKTVQSLARQKQTQPVVKEAPAATPTETPAPEVDPIAAKAEEVEKAGAKISKTRLSKVVAAHKNLTELLKDLGVIDAAGTAVSKSDATPEAEATPEATEDNQLTEVIKQIGDVATEVKSLSDTVASIQGESAQSQQPGNGTTVEPVEKGKEFWGGIL